MKNIARLLAVLLTSALTLLGGESAAPDTFFLSSPTGFTNSSTEILSFDAFAPGGLQGFEGQLDGGGFAPVPSVVALSGLADGSHTYEVRAVDNFGQVDLSPASVTWSVDTTKPTAFITDSPISLTSANSAAISFTGDDGSGSGVVGFQGSLDGNPFTPVVSPANLSGLADGPHSFSVRAVDAVGNVGANPDSISWTVDATPPDTFITDGPSGLTTSTDAVISYYGDDGTGSGVNYCEGSLDGAPFTRLLNFQIGVVFGSGGQTVTLSGLADGPHTYEIRAVDNAGNVDPTPASISWTVDTTPPDTSITNGPSGTTGNTYAQIDFDGNDGAGSGVSSFEGSLDGEPYSPFSSPAFYEALSEGEHTFSVRAIDAAGNVDPSPARATWTIITIPAEGIAVNDAAVTSSGETVLYPLANDTGTLSAGTITAVSDAAITIDGRRLIVPANYSGSFTYTVSDVATATVFIERSSPSFGARQWAGLIYDGNGAIAGILQVKRTRSGVFSGTLKAGTSISRSVFTLNHGEGIFTGSLGSLALTEEVTGQISVTSNSYSGILRPCVTLADPRQLNIALASIQPSAIPGGGVMRSLIKSSGRIAYLGTLPDGKPFSGSTPLTDNNSYALYTLVVRTTPKAIVTGEFILADLSATDVTGELSWLKLRQPSGIHASGVDTILTANGCIYAAGMPLPNGPGTLSLTGGNLPADIVAPVDMSGGKPTPNSASVPKWSINPNTGRFVVRVKNPARTRQMNGFGIYLPKSNSAWGYFPGSTLGGLIHLTANLER